MQCTSDFQFIKERRGADQWSLLKCEREREREIEKESDRDNYWIEIELRRKFAIQLLIQWVTKRPKLPSWIALLNCPPELPSWIALLNCRDTCFPLLYIIKLFNDQFGWYLLRHPSPRLGAALVSARQSHWYNPTESLTMVSQGRSIIGIIEDF